MSKPKPKKPKHNGPTVACPGCKTTQPKRSDDAIYYCDKCRCQYDATPDEGGSHYSDPSMRMQRQEEFAARNKGRR